jgi:hypothetical protein
MRGKILANVPVSCRITAIREVPDCSLHRPGDDPPCLLRADNCGGQRRGLAAPPLLPHLIRQSERVDARQGLVSISDLGSLGIGVRQPHDADARDRTRQQGGEDKNSENPPQERCIGMGSGH